MKNLFTGIFIILIIALGAWLLFYNRAQAPAENILNMNEVVVPPTPVTPIAPATTTPAKDPSNQSGAGQISVAYPLKNDIISSPLNVTGQAKGGWYFEASAPIRIVDANGKILGQSFVQAQGEWMTPNFVPFKGTITFSQPTTSTGYVVFMNDNPSGLPENERSISIPIKFQ